MKKKLFRFLVFLAIGVLLFCGFWKVFHFKYARQLEVYYGLPRDTVDVLIVGSSHAYKHIDPSVLYEEEGISAYVLGSAAQPIWNSYYYIVEALRTQSPKLVIVECYKTTVPSDYSDDPTTVKAVSNMMLSWNRMEAIYNSVGDRSKLVDYYLEFPWFHSRYKELGSGDFVLDYGSTAKNRYFLGYNPLNKSIETELPEWDKVTERKELTEKNALYLDKIISLSKEKGFDLLFIITPFSDKTADRQLTYNAVQDFADEKGVLFLNCNLLGDEIGLDPKVDFSSSRHLSVIGAEKTTRYLAQYIRQHFELEDHRGDSRFDRWEQNMLQHKARREKRKKQ